MKAPLPYVPAMLIIGLRQFEEMTKNLNLTKDESLREVRVKKAIEIFRWTGWRHIQEARGEVETWWDKRSQNWITTRYDRTGQDGGSSEYAGEKVGAALNHCTALVDLLNDKVFQ